MVVVGHFASLADAQLMSQGMLEPGLIEETIEEGHLAAVLPTTQITGKDYSYLRRGTPQDGAFFDIHEQIPWSSGADRTKITTSLKRIIRQEILDSDIMETYGDVNDYRAEALSELRFGVMRTAEDKFIYGNSANNAKEFDGMHALVPSANVLAASSSDTEGPATITLLRQLVDLVRPEPSELLINRDYSRRVDEAYEMGIAYGAAAAPVRALGMDMVQSRNDVGKVSSFFRGIPFRRTDFITQTEATSSDVFSTKTAGTGTSIFAVRYGKALSGGFGMVIGSGSGGGPSLYQAKMLTDLEDYDGDGIRLRARLATYLGSTKGLAALVGIDTAVAITK